MKRENKDKEQILREMKAEEKRKARIDKERFIAQTAFPFVEKLKIVYDAQTAVNAASGYIQNALAGAMAKINVRDLDITVKEDEKGAGDIKLAVENIIKATADITAKDVADILERMGNNFTKYTAEKGLKEPMTITTKEFVDSGEPKK